MNGSDVFGSSSERRPSPGLHNRQLLTCPFMSRSALADFPLRERPSRVRRRGKHFERVLFRKRRREEPGPFPKVFSTPFLVYESRRKSPARSPCPSHRSGIVPIGGLYAKRNLFVHVPADGERRLTRNMIRGFIRDTAYSREFAFSDTESVLFHCIDVAVSSRIQKT